MLKNNLVESLSGIRGLYGHGITTKLAHDYAYAYCQLFIPANAALVISGDSRLSTLPLKEAMIKAFIKAGIKKIIDLGIVPVPVCEYAVTQYRANGGIYLTASHNEPEYNGWKILKADGALLYPQQSAQLIKVVHHNLIPQTVAGMTDLPIADRHDDIIERYLDFILKQIGPSAVQKIREKNFTLLADPNGGSAINILPKLFKKLNVHAKIVNEHLREFKRAIEPTVETLSYLDKFMSEGNYAFACGFDCDADRVELVLPSKIPFARQMGVVLSGQYVLALACDAVLSGTANQTIVTNDCTSYLIRDVIKNYGATIYETEVGEMNVVQDMEKYHSIIGGEGSNGGVIIPPIKCRDGIMTVALILKMLAEKNTSLSKILNNYPKYYSQRTKVSCNIQTVALLKQKLENYFKNKNFKIMKTGDVTGGLKILFDSNSYIWFRQSKTEASVFRIIADGDDRKKVANIFNEGIKAFNKCK